MIVLGYDWAVKREGTSTLDADTPCQEQIRIISRDGDAHTWKHRDFSNHLGAPDVCSSFACFLLDR